MSHKEKGTGHPLQARAARPGHKRRKMATFVIIYWLLVAKRINFNIPLIPYDCKM
jgi:hypothetical protein